MNHSFSLSLHVTVIFGSSSGCCGHHHWLLFLLPRGQEFTYHGILQKPGATGQFAGHRGFSFQSFCFQVHSILNLTMYLKMHTIAFMCISSYYRSLNTGFFLLVMSCSITIIFPEKVFFLKIHS